MNSRQRSLRTTICGYTSASNSHPQNSTYRLPSSASPSLQSHTHTTATPTQTSTTLDGATASRVTQALQQGLQHSTGTTPRPAVRPGSGNCEADGGILLRENPMVNTKVDDGDGVLDDQMCEKDSWDALVGDDVEDEVVTLDDDSDDNVFVAQI